MLRPVTLQDWSARYALRRGLAKKAAYYVGHTIAIFDQWLGRPATVADLDTDTVSQWVAWLEEAPAPAADSGRYSDRTRAGLRGNLLCLWRFVAEEGECQWPGRIRRAPKPEPQPVAWTLEELRRIRVAAAQARGFVHGSGAPRALYLVTLVDAAYETGLRRGDLWRLEQCHFLANGTVVLRQNKTGWPHGPQVQPDTLSRIRQLPGDYPLRWPGTDKGFYECWRIWVITAAGVRPGALQQLRRSGATHLETIRPQDTSRYLGHKTPDMKKHYVDRSQAYGPAPMPPKFWW